jgi:hypothetical protein
MASADQVHLRAHDPPDAGLAVQRLAEPAERANDHRVPRWRAEPDQQPQRHAGGDGGGGRPLHVRLQPMAESAVAVLELRQRHQRRLRRCLAERMVQERDVEWPRLVPHERAGAIVAFAGQDLAHAALQD